MTTWSRRRGRLIKRRLPGVGGEAGSQQEKNMWYRRKRKVASRRRVCGLE
jgi:hypothetical protein